MTTDDIIAFVDALDGVLTLRPAPGDGSPELAWGDAFFYYSPDGVVPATTQPFATIVTKDYPGDEASRLDRPDAFRVNIAVGRDEFVRLIGRAPRQDAAPGEADPGTPDTLVAHPVYGTAGWVAVVNPGRRTERTVRDLLSLAHGLARDRYERRAGAVG
ncbi:hypothetical protein DZF91_31450 [Actinomadura logoneensis]|uniref:DUF6194 domain-containing protein n=1 Tax=Actinomadura logoneensis TaxID=2293572 RepID=A0A372JCH6_9ACTN|nr:DUF6194 family protein [Actinomadura logoneensis]RFU37707.1 hypothetical protein DZF91_31450 [Actinomadura logoneensis]